MNKNSKKVKQNINHKSELLEMFITCPNYANKVIQDKRYKKDKHKNAYLKEW